MKLMKIHKNLFTITFQFVILIKSIFSYEHI